MEKLAWPRTCDHLSSGSDSGSGSGDKGGNAVVAEASTGVVKVVVDVSADDVAAVAVGALVGVAVMLVANCANSAAGCVVWLSGYVGDATAEVIVRVGMLLKLGLVLSGGLGSAKGVAAALRECAWPPSIGELYPETVALALSSTTEATLGHSKGDCNGISASAV